MFLAEEKRGLALGILVVILALVLGNVTFAPSTCVRYLIFSGYYWMFSLFAFWVFSGVRWIQLKKKSLLRKISRTAVSVFLGSALFAGIFIYTHESPGYKIIMDEPTLIGTSYMLHKERKPLCPARAHHIQGIFSITNSFADKRPLAFPFLASLVHDALGYRPENVFALNILLSLSFLFVLAFIGNTFGGIFGGAFSIYLWTTCPTFIQMANSGGFEIFNLLVIALTFLFCLDFSLFRQKESLNALCTSALVLVNTRYENALYLGPIALILCYTFWKNRKIKLSWLACFSSLWLIPYFWGLKCFKTNPGFWELNPIFETQTPFALKFLPRNFGHTLRLFFDSDGIMPNSLFFSCLFFFVIVFVVRAISRWKALRQRTKILSLFLLTFGFYLVVLLFYFIPLDNPMIQRLALPLYLPLTWCTIDIIFSPNTSRNCQLWIFIFSLICLIFWTLPKINQNLYKKTFLPPQHAKEIQNFIKTYSTPNYFIFSTTPTIFLNYQKPATHIRRLQEQRDKIASCLAHPDMPEILIHEELNFSSKTNTFINKTYPEIEKQFEIVPIFERKISQHFLFRVGKITGIKGEPPEPLPNPTNLVEWVKALP